MLDSHISIFWSKSILLNIFNNIVGTGNITLYLIFILNLYYIIILSSRIGIIEEVGLPDFQS